LDLAQHPFLEIIWSFFIIFVWVAWFWLLISIGVDIFRRHDISGGLKAVWLIFIVFVPFLGVLVYVLTQSKSMQERSIQEANQQKRAMDDYIRATATTPGGAATEIAQAKALRDDGTITEEEFNAIKARALASS
jgi:putative oligomerization/nucleic acid binding protein/phospholipase D-like protein